MGLIKNYPEGSDITIMNTMYLKPRKNDNTGKWDNGSMTIIYKDNNTGLKYHEAIDNPDFEFYTLKPEYQIPDYNMMFIEKDKVDKQVVKYKDLEKTIAKLTGNEEFYFNNIKTGNRYENKLLHTIPSVFNSDGHIEDEYRFRFGNQYMNSINPISKAYFDIEVDGINQRGDFPELGECPINAITIIDEANDNVFTFLLRNKNNPLIEEFEKNINKDLFTELKEFIRNAVGGWKNEHRFGLQNLEFNFLFYDEADEIQLIQDLFMYINQFQPDFILAWNMAFDIPYIIERIKILGFDPADIMCHPDFEHKIARYWIDDRNVNEYSERGDFATISSYTTFLDQMIHFASRRKGQGEFASFGLDYIGGLVAKVKKYDYKHITTDITELPYKDYKVFIFYNIMDTIVQKCIEKKTGDVDYIFSKCVINNTRYHKGHRQTIYLRNRGEKEFLNDGDFIIGNNVAKFKPKPEKKFPGAFVGDPLLVGPYSKMVVNNIPIMVFRNLDDFDFKSLYPSILREFNIAPNTQKGMIVIPEQIHPLENPREDPKYSRGGAFVNDLQSQVYLLFCHRWLGMGNYLELYKDIEEYFTRVMMPSDILRPFNPITGYINPIIYCDKNVKVNPIVYVTDKVRPIVSYKKPNLDIAKEKYYVTTNNM